MTGAEPYKLVKILNDVADFYQIIPLEDAWQVVHSLLSDVERADYDERVRLGGYYYAVYADNLCHKSV